MRLEDAVQIRLWGARDRKSVLERAVRSPRKPWLALIFASLLGLVAVQPRFADDVYGKIRGQALDSAGGGLVGIEYLARSDEIANKS